MMLEEHEAKSEHRFETLKGLIHDKGEKMSKVENIFKTAGHGGDFGLGGGGLGLAAGGVGGLVLGALLNRGGLFGDGNGSETRLQDAVENVAVLTKLADIEAAIPQSALQVENSILSQTNELAGQISAQTLQLSSGLSNVKDAIVAQGAANLAATNQVNQNVLLSQSAVLQAICNSTNTIVSKIDANTIANLQAELAEVRSTGRSRDVEVNVTQNVNQQQAQLQTQNQIQALLAGVNTLIGNHQNLQQGIINLGTMTGNSQSAAQTRVN